MLSIAKGKQCERNESAERSPISHSSNWLKTNLPGWKAFTLHEAHSNSHQNTSKFQKMYRCDIFIRCARKHHANLTSKMGNPFDHITCALMPYALTHTCIVLRFWLCSNRRVSWLPIRQTTYYDMALWFAQCNPIGLTNNISENIYKQNRCLNRNSISHRQRCCCYCSYDNWFLVLGKIDCFRVKGTFDRRTTSPAYVEIIEFGWPHGSVRLIT